MKYFFDNNLPRPLAHAIRELLVPEGDSAEHLRDRFSADTPDSTWIEKLGSESDVAIITRDALYKGQLEMEALRESGLIVFALTKQWAGQKYWDIAAGLVRWWPRIMNQAALVEGGAIFKVPWRLTGGGKFEQVRLK